MDFKPSFSAAIFISAFCTGCASSGPCARAIKLAPAAEDLRQLQFLSAPVCEIENGSIIDRLASGAGPTDPGAADLIQRLHRQLLLANDGRSSSSQQELESGMVRGAYSFSEKRLILAAGVPQHLLDQTVVHELTHTLQDQHFDLRTILSAGEAAAAAGCPGLVRADSDRRLALFSLMEGDAEAVEYGIKYPNAEFCGEAEMARLTGSIRCADNPGLAQSPSYSLFRREFANRFGLRFICRSIRAGQDRNRLFRTPPKSTAELISPRSAEITPIVRSCPQDAELPAAEDHLGAAAILYLIGTSRPEIIDSYLDDQAVLFDTAGEKRAIWRIRFRNGSEIEDFRDLILARLTALAAATGRTRRISVRVERPDIVLKIAD